ncbi:MAG: hypothetical protein F4Y80_17435 [Caldilineaceae bacterium SB0665_bin_21]|nr:hypothetical protein [Caldilineaceae bacterium SB0665_bin_21]
MTRTRLILLGLLAAMLALAACGGPAAEEDAAAEPAPAEAADMAETTEEMMDGPMALDQEPWVDYQFSTPAEYEAETGNTLPGLQESPMLAARVASGDLPELSNRMPANPFVIRPPRYIGTYGGELRLVGFPEAGSYFTGFTESMQANLFTGDPKAGPDPNKYHPNLIEGYSIDDDGSGVTMNLRQGMKWSDGDPVDADDWVFWFDTILQDERLFFGSANNYQNQAGEWMSIEKVDDYTIRYDFNGTFDKVVVAWSTSRPVAPVHYLGQFHPDYDEDADANAQELGFDDWVGGFTDKNMRKNYSARPERPQLNPFILKDVEATFVTWERNPYYWRVDTAGNQLPYIDSILVNVVQQGGDPEVLKLKFMSQEFDYGPSQIQITDLPVLRNNEESGNYRVIITDNLSTSSALGVAFNYSTQDEFKSMLFNDVRFRQAHALAVDRNDLSETIFLGTTRPFTAPVSEIWTGYEGWMGTYFAEHDVERANALLDEMGLEWDANGEWRLDPNGDPITILGEYATEWLGYHDEMMELLVDDFKQIGIRWQPKFVPEDTLMSRYVANEHDVGIWNTDGGSELIAYRNYPMRLIPPWHWQSCCAMSSYVWRQWLDTDGAEGIEPPEQIKYMYDLAFEWLATNPGTEEYEAKINELITINVENLYLWGTVSSPPSVSAVSNRVQNIPEDEAFGGAAPGAYPNDVTFIHE